jgi:type II secretory pathway pseudopilin PulG
MRRCRSERFPSEGGFSLVELIIVMGIIVVMAAVILPPLASYMKMYQIRGATQQLAGDLSTSRMRAISKNVNLGVIVAVLSSNQYRIVTEDDLNLQVSPNWRSIATEDWPTVLSMPAQVGPIQSLPTGVQFDTPSNCGTAPGPPGAATDWGLRFTRLGAACGLSVSSCGGIPANVPAYTNYINVAGSLATVCLWQPVANLRRWVNVSTGGRVTVQP